MLRFGTVYIQLAMAYPEDRGVMVMLSNTVRFVKYTIWCVLARVRVLIYIVSYAWQAPINPAHTANIQTSYLPEAAVQKILKC